MEGDTELRGMLWTNQTSADDHAIAINISSEKRNRMVKYYRLSIAGASGFMRRIAQ